MLAINYYITHGKSRPPYYYEGYILLLPTSKLDSPLHEYIVVNIAGIMAGMKQ